MSRMMRRVARLLALLAAMGMGGECAMAQRSVVWHGDVYRNERLPADGAGGDLAACQHDA